MLEPYQKHRNARKSPLTLPSNVVNQRNYEGHPGRKGRMSVTKMAKYFLYMGLALVISSDFIFNPMATFIGGSQRALCSYFLGDLDTDSFWEQAFEVVASYLATDVTSLPPGDVGFVITITHCPEDKENVGEYIAHEDPGAAFYDAAAALKYRIETNLNSTGNYIASMHAIIHPDAIYCKGPDDLYYNR
mmetsp:Transcript_5344/g.8215  ORF Transcript_5344/g.8215 Transcript_5344/m.8215 type:complete len:189 (+) Transcript_5344:204-770(+)